MTDLPSKVSTPKKQLTLLDSLGVILGIVIGAGIYESTPLIARSLGDMGWLIGIWVVGGVISLIGALCYAELTTAYPEEGGDYVFLTRAFGPRTGFVFAWAGFWVVKPANIGALAFIFARYAQEILSLGQGGILGYAIGAIVVLTLANVLGVQSGKWTQNLLTVAKVLGLLLIIVIGLLVVAPSKPAAVATPAPEFNLYLALILVLFTYGGWSNISLVAAEVVEPRQNILRALVIGVVGVTLIYVLVNLAFLHALGFDGMIASGAVASDVVRLAFGEAGAVFISALICITCLANISAMIFAYARIYYAMGRDHPLYSWLGHWHGGLDAPLHSLLLQAIISLGLVVLIGGNADAFERLVVFSAPVHWFFFLMVALSLFLLRRKGQGLAGHYRVPLYPLLPFLFCCSTGFLLYASVTYAWGQRHPEALFIVVIVVLGVVLSFLNKEGYPSTSSG